MWVQRVTGGAEKVVINPVVITQIVKNIIIRSIK
tara:strand:+ start:552 stop:653 length:102 start_codon:yes stop_codon:yes gene_type:complete